MQSGVPGRVRPGRAAAGIAVVLGAWLALLGFGWWHHPALEPSMIGKRELCYLEVLAQSVPLMIIGLLLVRTLYPVNGRVSGALVGAVAGIVPAWIMQMACMYIVPHGLTHHLLPIAATVTVGGLLGSWLAVRRR